MNAFFTGWLFILATCGLLACDGLTLRVDEPSPAVPDAGPFVTSFICPQDSVLTVRVEKTLMTGAVEKTVAGETVVGAIVTLSDGFNSVTLSQNQRQSGRYETAPNALSIVGGRTYQLRVVTPASQTSAPPALCHHNPSAGRPCRLFVAILVDHWAA